MNYNNNTASQAEAFLWISLFYNPKNSISKDGSNKITESADKVTNTTKSETLATMVNLGITVKYHCSGRRLSDTKCIRWKATKISK